MRDHGKSCRIPMLAVAAALRGERGLIIVGTEERKKMVEDELLKYIYPRDLIVVETVEQPAEPCVSNLGFEFEGLPTK